MEALTSVIKEKTMKKILPFRSGDDGGPCAIARLVLAQARISNQQKQSTTIYPKRWRFIFFLKAMGFSICFKHKGNLFHSAVFWYSIVF